MSDRDRPTYEPEDAGDYLWLRYATHFSVGAREYTIEMGVPMPIGASYEEREQLLREADAGMNQLSGHVEEKVARLLQRIQPNQGPLPTPTPSVRSSATSSPSVASAPASSQRQTTRPASIPAEQTGPQSAFPTSADRSRDGRENRSPAAEQRTPVQQETNGPGSRPPNTGTPLMPMAAIDELTGNVSLPQFITIVRDTMGLNPKQAMEMLRVKSLTTINLRDALEKLRAMMETQDTEEPTKTNNGGAFASTNTASNQKLREAGQGEGRTPTGKPTPSSSTPVNTPGRSDARPSLSIPGLSVGTGNIKSAPKPVRRDEEADIREERPIYTFDEEEDNALEDLLEDEEEEDNELSPQALAQARALVNQFRESRGPTVANTARLQVLSNVLDGQIDEDQLLDLIEGIWGVNNSRKLKVDQVELLISWAKTDEFLEEVNAVLTVLEEEM